MSFIPPQLPTLVDNPPEGGDWSHEIKFDGYRSQFVVDAEGVRAFTRNGFDWTVKFAPLVDAVRRLDLDSAIIDGEVIVADDVGRSNFNALRSLITKAPDRLIFVAFDLLHLGGHSLMSMPVEERRHILEDCIPDGHAKLRFSTALQGETDTLFAAVDRAGLEGMVSKRLGSIYRSGRSETWLKAKCYEESELPIVGVQRERGKPAMALMADRQGKYAGAAFVTLNRQIRERLWAKVQAHAGGKAPAGIKTEKAEWVKPGLVARIKHLKGEQTLRHATVQDFREESE